MEELLHIIKSIESSRTPHINPTEIYNEGWMVRLLVSQSVSYGLTFCNVNFENCKNWTSEALIASPFVDAPIKREGYTHADIAFGDFSVDYEKRGEIIIDADAKQFGIIEAKMGSNLSQSTSNAPNYDQASRNLACIAHQTVDINRCNEKHLIVAAPEQTIDKHRLMKQVDLNTMVSKIEDRFEEYSFDFQSEKSKDKVVENAKNINVDIWSFEDWINAFDGNQIWYVLDKFYRKALKWNRLNA